METNNLKRIVRLAVVAVISNIVLAQSPVVPSPVVPPCKKTSPSVLSKVDPSYTQQAQQAKLKGVVVLSLFINEQGTADTITVVKSIGMGLDEQAIAAVQQWRFNPAQTNCNGVITPTRVKAQVEVNFDYRFVASK